MTNRTVHTDRAPAAIGPYSQGVIANGFLFTAGQIAIDPATGQVIGGDVVAQAGDIMTRPGLPKEPAAERMAIRPDGSIVGLF